MSEGRVRVGWGVVGGDRMCGCDKTLKAFWKRFRDTPEARVTADTSWPSVLPMLHKVLETALFHSLLVLIYTLFQSAEQQGAVKRCTPWTLGWCRARPPGGSICKSPTSTRRKAEARADLKVACRARELSHPGRNCFSFNYMFHVHVPMLHARRLLSRPNISHAYPHLDAQVVAYLNTTARGLQWTCAEACCLRHTGGTQWTLCVLKLS